jgi:hypothetical protein
MWTGNSNGCRALPRCFRLPFLSRSGGEGLGNFRTDPRPTAMTEGGLAPPNLPQELSCVDAAEEHEDTL